MYSGSFQRSSSNQCSSLLNPQSESVSSSQTYNPGHGCHALQVHTCRMTRMIPSPTRSPTRIFDTSGTVGLLSSACSRLQCICSESASVACSSHPLLALATYHLRGPRPPGACYRCKAKTAVMSCLFGVNFAQQTESNRENNANRENSAYL